MAKDYVRKYLWRDYGQPFATAWQITLTADEAVAFLVMVSILITYTQTRTWSLARKAVIRRIRPIQLPDDDTPNSLSKLSQYDAISRLISDISPWIRRRMRRTTVLSSMTITSPLFGTAAIGNAIFFITMGALVPWLLTGGLETPVLQTRIWDGCRGFRGSYDAGRFYFYTADRITETHNYYFALEKYRQCWRNPPDPFSGSCSRVDSPIMDQPPITISQDPDSCSFTEQECVANLSQFQLDHENLTLRDYGLNIQSALRHSRCLTCSPVDIQVVIVNHKHDYTSTTENVDHNQQPELHRNQGAFRSTTSMPNQLNRILVTIESYQGDGRFECRNCERLYQLFERNHGQTFFVLVENGTFGRNTSQHGPGGVFAILLQDGWEENFTSHRYRLIGDYARDGYAVEMCQEQHRFCLQDNFNPGSNTCTQFTNSWTALQEVSELIKESALESTASDLCTFSELFYKTTIFTLLREGRTDAIHPWSELYTTPWTMEAIKWFQGPLMLTRLNLYSTITASEENYVNTRDPPPEHEEDATSPVRRVTHAAAPPIPAKYFQLVCESGLLLGSDYTNINFLGLIMTLLVVVLINSASHWQALKAMARRIGGKIAATYRNICYGASRAWMECCMLLAMALTSTTYILHTTIRAIRRPSRGAGLPSDQSSHIDLAALHS